MFRLYICTAIWLFGPPFFFSLSDTQISRYVLNTTNTKRLELHIYAWLRFCSTSESNIAVDSLQMLVFA